MEGSAIQMLGFRKSWYKELPAPQRHQCEALVVTATEHGAKRAEVHRPVYIGPGTGDSVMLELWYRDGGHSLLLVFKGGEWR